eukprot:5992311-Amphidinium_carterae.1
MVSMSLLVHDNKVFSRSRLLLLICSWLGSAEAARPSTVDHVQLSETDPSYFAEVLDSAIGMFKARTHRGELENGSAHLAPHPR